MPEREPDQAWRLRHVFGDVLPEFTADERPEYGDTYPDDGDRTEWWWRHNQPPHHDGGSE